MAHIPFNKPCRTGSEGAFIATAIQSNHLSGNGPFAKKCQTWFETRFDCRKTMLTPSCTQSLEMAAILADIQPGDEIIMPSFTFVSTANAFVLRGAQIRFVDIRPDTMNLDETKIEQALTKKTRAIVPVHYAGVSCEMDAINQIAKQNNLFVIEDAAQGMMATYKNKFLGTIGDFGTYSFHETKNYTAGGEGGLLLVNNKDFEERAEIIREKGTNRSQFFRGMVDKYTWFDIGSSYLPSEIQAAYLFGQLENADKIAEARLASWKRYHDNLLPLAKKELIELPSHPDHCIHNGHIFYIKAKNLDVRTKLLNDLKEKDVNATFHYIPLHTSPAGIKFGKFVGEDRYSTAESERLLRLPMFYGLTNQEIDYVSESITGFFSRI